MRGLLAFVFKIGKACLLAFWTIGTSAFFIPLLVLALPIARLEYWWRGIFFGVWCRGVLLILGTRTTVFGPTPPSPFFLVSNHLSYLDIVVYGALFNCVFVAKRDVRAWPFIGWVASLIGTIFVDREKRSDVKKVGDDMIRELKRHRSVLLFPEGTSTNGTDVASFKPSLLVHFARELVPVYYAALMYETGSEIYPASNYVCWWGDDEFVAHLWQLLGLRSIQVSVRFGSHPYHDSDRKRLAHRLHDLVKDLLTCRS